MLKAQPGWSYEYQGQKRRLTGIYSKLNMNKTRGKSEIKAEAIVKLSGNDRYNLLSLFQLMFMSPQETMIFRVGFSEQNF
jgi:hypothetical protein